MNLRIFNADFRRAIDGGYKMIFADPPDNIGLKYDGFTDRMSDSNYEWLLEDTLTQIRRCDILWMSFNPNHIKLVARLVDNIVSNSVQVSDRWFMQHVTFGYYMKEDFGRCFRPLVRLMWNDAETYPDAIRVESVRQKMGDPRANPDGKIPGDVWTINRVQGNNKQRRKWHNTQLNEDLYTRCLKFSTKPGDRVADLYAGTGTMARAAKDLDLDVELFDVSTLYCEKIAEEFGVEVR